MKDYTNFFTELENTSPFMKVALQGLAGSGKSRTGAIIAGGIHYCIKSTKPIVIYDTEKSAKFLRPYFAEKGIKVVVRDSRSLSDLSTAMDYCADGFAEVLLIDSITHVWNTFIKAYLEKYGKKRVSLPDWGILKPMWQEKFSDRVVNDRYHIVFTGRQGDDYEDQINEDTGKRESVKVGVKMKAEKETAFEPDLLLMMESEQDLSGDQTTIARFATVLKDRSTLIDGKRFKNPTFKDFKPVFDFLMTDVSEPKKTKETNDGGLITLEQDNREAETQRQIVLERVWNILKKHAGGTAKVDKARYFELLSLAFHGEQSETAIEKMNIMELQSGLDKLRLELEPIPEGNLI